MMTIRQKQLLLAYLDCYAGQIDGIWGAQSRSAEATFRRVYMENDRDASEEQFQQRLREAVGSGENSDSGASFWEEIRWFQRKEFACRCGKCGGFPVEPEERLIRTAERLRNTMGSAVNVSSGVRCAAHNGAVGGVSNSRHLLGKAMDFCVAGKRAAEVLPVVRQQPEIRYAYAIDEWYVHLDVE